jgi:hypothetical protein
MEATREPVGDTVGLTKRLLVRVMLRVTVTVAAALKLALELGEGDDVEAGDGSGKIVAWTSQHPFSTVFVLTSSIR